MGFGQELMKTLQTLYNISMAKKKTSKATTNIRQKKVITEMLENGRSVSAAMKEAGYSEAYSKHPEKLRRTKNFQDLLEEHLPDELLVERHHELVKSKDENIGLRAVEAGYKIKNKYEPEETIHTFRRFEEMSDEELQEQLNARLIKAGKDRNTPNGTGVK
jgi:hypothetical protein